MLQWQDGITWLLNPPTQSLAFILADKGFEVWLMNTRGTKYSLGHTSLISNNSVFLKNNSFLGIFFFLLNKLLSRFYIYMRCVFLFVGLLGLVMGWIGFLWSSCFIPICIWHDRKETALCWTFLGEMRYFLLFFAYYISQGRKKG